MHDGPAGPGASGAPPAHPHPPPPPPLTATCVDILSRFCRMTAPAYGAGHRRRAPFSMGEERRAPIMGDLWRKISPSLYPSLCPSLYPSKARSCALPSLYPMAQDLAFPANAHLRGVHAALDHLLTFRAIHRTLRGPKAILSDPMLVMLALPA